MKTNTLYALAAAFLISGTAAFAEEGKGSLNDADAKFVKTAVMSGKSEVRIAELGAQKATNPEVKATAEKVIKDHTVINAELEAFAKSKGVELSQANDPDADKAIADLEKLSGADFDKAFMNHLEEGHEDSVSNYKDAAEDSTDGDLKAWAGKTLPIIEGHLTHVENVMKDLK